MSTLYGNDVLITGILERVINGVRDKLEAEFDFSKLEIQVSLGTEIPAKKKVTKLIL